MSGQNYIGSKISLISLSDIRYVGILHNINPIESTVALQNVKSFGTEGRKGNPKEEIPATDNVFDYVVFRGTDIKDLQVFEAPPSFQPSSQQQHEPVVNTMPTMYQSHYYPSKPYDINSPSYVHGSNYWQNTPYVAQQPSHVYQQSQHLQRQSPPQAYPPMPLPEDYRMAATNDLATPSDQKTQSAVHSNSLADTNDTMRIQEKTVASPAEEKTKISPSKPSPNQEKKEAGIANKADDVLIDSLVKQVSDLSVMQPRFSTQTKTSKVSRQKNREGDSKNMKRTTTRHVSNSAPSDVASITPVSAPQPSVTQRNLNESSNDNTRNHKHNGNYASNSYRRNSQGIVVPKSDFDFASANAKFDKSNSVLNANGKDTQAMVELDSFYDKKKSFFDDISCESKEYQNGNRGGNYKEESKLNLETFGLANPSGQDTKRHRSRHRPRGSRGKRRNRHQDKGNKEITV